MSKIWRVFKIPSSLGPWRLASKAGLLHRVALSFHKKIMWIKGIRMKILRKWRSTPQTPPTKHLSRRKNKGQIFNTWWLTKIISTVMISGQFSINFCKVYSRLRGSINVPLFNVKWVTFKWRSSANLATGWLLETSICLMERVSIWDKGKYRRRLNPSLNNRMKWANRFTELKYK